MGGFVHNLRAASLLQLFLIAAVASVLTVRAFLAATDYPKIGGGTLHIAHLVPGGLLMLGALIILLSFYGQPAARAASLIGGVGFGLFIDELGKFITANNNYFFHPTIALIYLTFLVLFLVFRLLDRPWHMGQDGYLINVLSLVYDPGFQKLDLPRWKRAQALIANCDPANPLVIAIREAIGKPYSEPQTRDSATARVLGHVRAWYDRLVSARWFYWVVVILFFLSTAVVILIAVALVLDLFFGMSAPIDLSSLIGFLAVLPSAALAVIGVTRSRHSDAEALIWFRRSVLVSIFLVDVFAFYQSELAALVDFSWDLVLLLLLTSMIGRRRHQAALAAHVAA